jgi:hypothetical protein
LREIEIERKMNQEKKMEKTKFIMDEDERVN